MKVLSVALLVSMQGFIKASGDVPLGQVGFFRYIFALLPIMAYLAWRRELSTAFHTRHPFSHLVRSMVGVMGMLLIFYSILHLPLPEAIVLGYAQPLFIVVLSAAFLHERIRLYRWTAVVVGIIGVVIVAWPNLTLLSNGLGGEAAWGALAALAGAAVSAVAMLLVRRLITTEKSATIVLMFSLFGGLCMSLTWFLGWVELSATQWVVLILSGICGGIGQIMMTEAYRYAEASTVAPFEYTSLIFSLAIGFFIFGDMPTPYTVIGGSIIIASAVFVVWREHRLGLERARARQISSQ